MNINILCVGKLKEKYLKDAFAEYSKRLTAYAKIEITEVADEKTPDGTSPAEENLIKAKEGQRLLTKIKERDFVIALELNGSQKTSEQFADLLQQAMLKSMSSIVFVIGGSLGLNKPVLDRADYRLSFSQMTFPHQLMRIILMEQVYRAFKIIRGEPYHK